MLDHGTSKGSSKPVESQLAGDGGVPPSFDAHHDIYDFDDIENRYVSLDEQGTPPRDILENNKEITLNTTWIFPRKPV